MQKSGVGEGKISVDVVVGVGGEVCFVVAVRTGAGERVKRGVECSVAEGIPAGVIVHEDRNINTKTKNNFLKIITPHLN